MEKSITKGWLAVVTVFAAMTLALCAFAPTQAYGAENPGDNGFQKTSAGKIFFENAKGKKVTGWFQVKGDGGKWYYADASGVIKKGWLKDNGKWYYLDPQGGDIPYMVADKIAYVTGKYVYWDKPNDGKFYTPYYFGKKGDMKIGWVKLPSGAWLYADGNGVLAEGWKKISGKYYYFGSKPVPGDLKDFEGEWYPASTASKTPEKIGKYCYFFDKSTAMVTGWQKAEGKWYFFKNDGPMVTNKWIKDGGKWYHLGADGAMQTGWFKDGGKWYFFGANGAMKTGWVKTGGKWYFFNASGAMLANKWVQTNGKWYFVGKDGAMITNAWVDVWHVGANGAWDKSKNNNNVTPTNPPSDPVIIFTA